MCRNYHESQVQNRENSENYSEICVTLFKNTVQKLSKWQTVAPGHSGLKIEVLKIILSLLNFS